MVLPAPPNILIRDGMESDIPTCLGIDHTYTTDTVWQMQLQHQEYRDEYQISLKMERLPRAIEIAYPSDETRLRLAIPSEHCFVVAADRESGQVLGYLAMYHDQVRQIGQIQDLVIDREQRRLAMGTRLINVARRWAKEHALTRLMIQTQTKNYPSIAFSQKLGFTFCGFNDRFFPNGDIAVFFSQSLR